MTASDEFSAVQSDSCGTVGRPCPAGAEETRMRPNRYEQSEEYLCCCLGAMRCLSAVLATTALAAVLALLAFTGGLPTP